MKLFSNILICGNQNNIKTNGVAGNLLSVSEDYKCTTSLNIISFSDVHIKITTNEGGIRLNFKNVQEFLGLFCVDTPDIIDLHYSKYSLLIQLRIKAKAKT